MTDFIVCCDCGDTQKYSVESYRLLAKTKRTPDVFLSNKVHTLLERLPKDTNVYGFAERMMNTKGKYSYYIAYDDNGDVVEQWNLLSGSKLITHDNLS